MKHYRYRALTLLTLIYLLVGCSGTRQVTQRSAHTADRQYLTYAVAFYNIENLFDPDDDPANPGDDEFLPSGSYNWTTAKYERKLDNIAKVISRLAREVTPTGPFAIGIAEVENRRVLDDLVARPALRDMHLKVVHEDSPDRRGIDVALLYNPKIFTLESHSTHRFPHLDNNPGYTTRDQLLVTGRVAGERLHLIVGHWPSRYGGSKSSYLRETAASLSKQIVDSLNHVEKDPKIIIMGDLNDNPTDRSVTHALQAKSTRTEVQPGGLYNPAVELFNRGIGTLAYQNKWSLFDQMISSYGLLDSTRRGLHLWKMEIFNRDFLITKEGKRKGYPHRTFDGNTFINGYSDHFPVITYLVKPR